jgi:hypothetical protein
VLPVTATRPRAVTMETAYDDARPLRHLTGVWLACGACCARWSATPGRGGWTDSGLYRQATTHRCPPPAARPDL